MKSKHVYDNLLYYQYKYTVINSHPQMSKVKTKYNVTVTGYTYRIPRYIEEESPQQLSNVVYIYSDPLWNNPGFWIPITSKEGGFKKVSYEKWNTSKYVRSAWRDIHDAMIKVYGAERPFKPYKSKQSTSKQSTSKQSTSQKVYENYTTGYVVTKDGGIQFNPMDYCYGRFMKSEMIKTDNDRYVSVSIWDCESG